MFFRALSVIGFFSAYLGNLGFISYLVVTKYLYDPKRFHYIEIIFLSFFVSKFFIDLFAYRSLEVFYVYRFYIGFIFFYFAFKKININFSYIYLIMLFLIPLEFLLINFLVDPWLLPNYPSKDTAHYGQFVNGIGYMRVYSFGENASVLSSLLTALFAYAQLSNLYLVPHFFLLLLSASGTGYIIFFIFCIFRFVKFFIFFFSLITLVLLFSANYLLNFIDSYLGKIALDYVSYLYNLKIFQINEIFHNFSLFDYIFGSFKPYYSGIEGYGGDFGWRYFWGFYGILGSFILLIFVLFNLTQRNSIPIFLLFIATFHYPVIFFLPGQVLFAYLLTENSRNEQ